MSEGEHRRSAAERNAGTFARPHTDHLLLSTGGVRPPLSIFFLLGERKGIERGEAVSEGNVADVRDACRGKSSSSSLPPPLCCEQPRWCEFR